MGSEESGSSLEKEMDAGSELCPAVFSVLASTGGMDAICSLGPQPSCSLSPHTAPSTMKVREGSRKSQGKGLIYNISVTVP